MVRQSNNLEQWVKCTPRHIIDFIVAAVDPKKDETIRDPAYGTAGFLISAYKHIFKQHGIPLNPPLIKGESSKATGGFKSLTCLFIPYLIGVISIL
ncbi:SAM-dependent methyltransferase, partial [bacterium]|nr:SAM-dependent methyltransferase [bacterium]